MAEPSRLTTQRFLGPNSGSDLVYELQDDGTYSDISEAEGSTNVSGREGKEMGGREGEQGSAHLKRANGGEGGTCKIEAGFCGSLPR
jgi:hypothetical protein